MGENERPPVVFLMGPTASGKTELAIGLSDRLPIDLISVDSALVYRGMDIGSAKPDRKILQQYPHALIDIRDPSEAYSAAEFQKEALEHINESHSAGRIPLLVGGTMLYFKALRDGIADMPKTNIELRAEIETRAEKYGWAALYEELREVDPATAARLHPNHSARIERALQVYHATGIPMSEYHLNQKESDFTDRFDLRQIGLCPQDRQKLHDRIEKRLGAMFEHGFIEEVGRLYDRGDLSAELPSIRAVGYRQLWSFFEGEFDLSEAKQRAFYATRKLAKRQLTWMRSWDNLNLTNTQDDQGATLGSDLIVHKCLKFLDLN